MTGDEARQTARAWLAERIGEKEWARVSVDGVLSIACATAEDLADAILAADGVQVDHFAVLDGPTLNLTGKRIVVTLPLMPLVPGDEEWLFEPPEPRRAPAQPIGEQG